MGLIAKIAMTMNVGALAFIIAEALMGPTILGNVIFLGLAILLAATGGLLGLVAWLERRSMGRLAAPLMSFVLLAYIVLRFYSDSVPAGYGP